MNGNYRTIVVPTSGSRKILRLSYKQVAHVVSEVNKFRRNIFSGVKTITLNGDTLCLNEIISWKFINERTGQELLTI